jgi:hypothetical protein
MAERQKMIEKWKSSDGKDYRDAQKERGKLYSRIDRILYEMCKKWPEHSNLGEIQAKVTIIGRTYATGIERKGNRDKKKGLLETVSKILYKKRRIIDRNIRLPRRYKRLTQNAQIQILASHGRIASILKNGTKSKINFRSFVSKYLHFHAPIVPIFDSRAVKMMNAWYPWKECRKHTTIQGKRSYDKAYLKFFLQFILYMSDLKDLGLNPSIRDADYFLIWSSS